MRRLPSRRARRSFSREIRRRCVMSASSSSRWVPVTCLSSGVIVTSNARASRGAPAGRQDLLHQVGNNLLVLFDVNPGERGYLQKGSALSGFLGYSSSCHRLFGAREATV